MYRLPSPPKKKLEIKNAQKLFPKTGFSSPNVISVLLLCIVFMGKRGMGNCSVGYFTLAVLGSGMWSPWLVQYLHHRSSAVMMNSGPSSVAVNSLLAGGSKLELSSLTDCGWFTIRVGYIGQVSSCLYTVVTIRSDQLQF